MRQHPGLLQSLTSAYESLRAVSASLNGIEIRIERNRCERALEECWLLNGLASVIRELRPKTVILPYWEARHPDHYHASTLGYEGCFLAGLKALPISGEAYRPFKVLDSTVFAEVRPTFVVDITEQFERRWKAIRAFASQFRPAKGEPKSKVFLAIDRLEEEMNQLARHYGRMIGVNYGEPFLIKELMKVDDIVEMDVRSI